MRKPASAPADCHNLSVFCSSFCFGQFRLREQNIGGKRKKEGGKKNKKKGRKEGRERKGKEGKGRERKGEMGCTVFLFLCFFFHWMLF